MIPIWKHMSNIYTHTHQKKMMHDSLCSNPSHKASTHYTHICTFWGVNSSNSGVLPPRSRQSHKGSNKWSGKDKGKQLQGCTKAIKTFSSGRTCGNAKPEAKCKCLNFLPICHLHLLRVMRLFYPCATLILSSHIKPCRNHQGPSPHGVLATLSAVIIFWIGNGIVSAQLLPRQRGMTQGP